MSAKLTDEQQRFVARARAEIEKAIAGGKPRASKHWIVRLASETSPLLSEGGKTEGTIASSPVEVNERILAQALQSLYADLLNKQ
jgi:hypothetical protein